MTSRELVSQLGEMDKRLAMYEFLRDYPVSVTRNYCERVHSRDRRTRVMWLKLLALKRTGRLTAASFLVIWAETYHLSFCYGFLDDPERCWPDGPPEEAA